MKLWLRQSLKKGRIEFEGGHHWALICLFPQKNVSEIHDDPYFLGKIQILDKAAKSQFSHPYVYSISGGEATFLGESLKSANLPT